ncbi:class F sortase [Pseudalkalibacillus caeni]|uniref:Class F sortase n=1 Tax=Exobacillus caeni TaxID=2574798 RepID=A0A5R9EYP2_9BACL|nr:class F sortase [Pseudalkalibacillus caeni]TLS35961.1 class F sortase [Pseudalkalibacillus caeni]
MMNVLKLLMPAMLLLSGCSMAAQSAGDRDQNSGMQENIQQEDPLRTLPDSNISKTDSDKEIIKDNREGIIPDRLQIPAIGVDAEVEKVGMLSNGKMDVPKNDENVAWYQKGAQPGQPGNSVIAGHVDNKTGPAVFFKLEKLKKGDEIKVSGSDGNQRTFVVYAVKSYPRNEAPLNEIFGYTYRSGLNLITCTGDFDHEASTHKERLVVYTQLKN